MKTLLLMRHAKSSWKHHDLKDHDRPLNKRGKKDAPLMGKLIHEKELIPQIILCSSANRARLTAEGMLDDIDYKGEIRYLDSLYLAEVPAYIEEINNLPDEMERVLVIGHNPALESLLQILCSQVESLPTAALAYLSLPIQHWNELSDKTEGELVELLKPRELKVKSKK